jgi:hypothetical protein
MRKIIAEKKQVLFLKKGDGMQGVLSVECFGCCRGI